MMKFKIIIVMLFCIITDSVLAQESQEKRRENYMTFDLLSQANILNPRWKVGYVYSLCPKWKIGMDVGIGSDAINIYSNSNKQNFELWEIRPEFYYIINTSDRWVKYISAELFYIQESNRLIDEAYDAKSKGYYHFDSADFKRQKYGLNCKFGYFFDLNRNLGLNVYSGIGFRVKNNQFNNVINPSVKEDSDRLFIRPYNEKEGVSVGVNFSLGIKLYLKQ